MGRRIVIIAGLATAVLGFATGYPRLVIVGLLASGTAYFVLNGNGGRKF